MLWWMKPAKTSFCSPPTIRVWSPGTSSITHLSFLSCSPLVYYWTCLSALRNMKHTHVYFSGEFQRIICERRWPVLYCYALVWYPMALSGEGNHYSSWVIFDVLSVFFLKWKHSLDMLIYISSALRLLKLFMCALLVWTMTSRILWVRVLFTCLKHKWKYEKHW